VIFVFAFFIMGPFLIQWIKTLVLLTLGQTKNNDYFNNKYIINNIQVSAQDEHRPINEEIQNKKLGTLWFIWYKKIETFYLLILTRN
jgi:hypothetical protein